jgi:hypothetical protein
MTAILHIPEDVIEAILRDEPVADVYGAVAAFAAQMRVLENAPAPAASADLAEMLAGPVGLVAVGRPGGRPGRKRMPGIESVAGLGGKVASLGLVAKLGLGTSLAAAGVVGAGVAGVLPAAANEAVRDAVEVVSPVQFDSNDDTNFGDRVSTDATGESDGVNGVDGQQIADEAPGAANRPDSGPADEPPGQSGETGLTRANQTPAVDHAPDTPGASAEAGDSGQPDEAGDPDGDGAPGNTAEGGRPETVPSTVPERGDSGG